MVSMLGPRLDDSITCSFINSLREFTGCDELSSTPNLEYKLPANLECIEDRAAADYILNVPEQVNLAGPRFARRRQVISRFLRRYGDSVNHTYLEPDCLTTRRALAEVFDRWASTSTSDADHVVRERQALTRILDFKQTRIVVVCAYMGSSPVAFMVNEARGSACAVGHFFKSDHSIAGLSDFMPYAFASDCSRRGVGHLNIQMDLGIDGLRLKKSSLRADFLLRKYTIRNGMDHG